MSARDRVVITLVACLVILAAGWHFVISPKKAEAGKLATQVTAQQTALTAARAQLSQAVTARAAFSSAYTQLAKLGEAVPADDDVPSLIYQLQSAAKASSVAFQTLSVGTGSGSAAPSAPGSHVSTAILPPGVAVGPAGFPVEQFTFTFSGSFFRLADFFDRLQRFVVAKGNSVSVSGRLMTLNSVSLAPGTATTAGHIAANVSATAYLEPATQGLLVGATSAGPAGTATAPAASTSGSSTAAPAAVASPTK